ncbi:MAG: cation diffusion facilitator family transporter [Gammaproteobacteria bacterium]
MNTNTPMQQQQMRRATYLAVAAATLLIVIKLIAYLLSGSVSILSSLIDSIVDLFASGINLFAVAIALQPPDREHRFGHGKAEPIAGLAQAMFISGSAVFLVIEAASRLLRPEPIQHAGVGIGVMVMSIAITILLVIYQRRVIAATGSVAISADSLHYRSDVLVGLGVIAALLLDSLLDWRWADPVIALIVAGYILYAAWQIGRQALDQLMDRELSDAERERIQQIVCGHAQVSDLHELRTRASGLSQFIQLHLVLQPEMTLHEAHHIAMQVQQDLQQAYPHADIIIHQDPADDSGDNAG